MGWKAAQKLIHHWRILRGDNVMIIRGKDKGETGTVKRVVRSQNRVIVEGKNLVKKHIKQGQGHEGGIFSVEAPLHVSNVQVVDPVTGKPCKVGIKYMEDGSKVRVSRGIGASGSIIPRPEILKMRTTPRPTIAGPKDTPMDVVLEKTYDPQTGMSRPLAPAAKWRRPGIGAPPLSEPEQLIYDLIMSKGNDGILLRGLKFESKLAHTVINQTLKSLLGKELIKEVKSIKHTGTKVYMEANCTPYKEVSGGVWYDDGKLDQELVGAAVQDGKMLTIEIPMPEMAKLLTSMVLEDEITEHWDGGLLWTSCWDNLLQNFKYSSRGSLKELDCRCICFHPLWYVSQNFFVHARWGYLPGYLCVLQQVVGYQNQQALKLKFLDSMLK